MSTYQAVVEALGLLERDAALRASLLAPLALLTAHQAAFDPSVASRMAGKKEGEEGTWTRGNKKAKGSKRPQEEGQGAAGAEVPGSGGKAARQ